MTQFKNLEDFLGPMTGTASRLVVQYPKISKFTNLFFPTITTDPQTAAWYTDYGLKMDKVCGFIGTTGRFSAGTPAQQRAVLTLVKAVLAEPSNLNKTALIAAANDLYNPFTTQREGSNDAELTYTTLITCITALVFEDVINKAK